MKKWISFVLSVALLLSIGLAACGDQSSNPSGAGQTDNAGEQQTIEPIPESSWPSNDLPGSDTQSPTAPDAEGGNSIVYMTTDSSPEGLMAVYDALGWTPEGNVAVKLSTGEPPASNYLRPKLIADVVSAVNGTIVECNTAYGGSRAETAMHYQVAEDHGFTAIADFQILDENGSISLPVVGGTRLTENFVGAAFADYDSYLILSHFKGHSMAGFGGAIKNISIGLAPSEGLMTGYGNGRFGTDDSVTREQLATVLWRYAGSPAAMSSEDFADASAISSYAVQAVDWAQSNGIINGVGSNRFDPTGIATRAQVATILYRWLSTQEGETEPVPDDGDTMLSFWVTPSGTAICQ